MYCGSFGGGYVFRAILYVLWRLSLQENPVCIVEVKSSGPSCMYCISCGGGYVFRAILYVLWRLCL